MTYFKSNKILGVYFAYIFGLRTLKTKLLLETTNVTAATNQFLICENRLPLLYSTNAVIE